MNRLMLLLLAGFSHGFRTEDLESSTVEAIEDGNNAATTGNNDKRELTNYLQFGSQCESGKATEHFYEADIFLQSPLNLFCYASELIQLGRFVDRKFDKKVNDDSFLDEITLKTHICQDPLNVTERRLRYGRQHRSDRNSGRKKSGVWGIVSAWYGDGSCKFCSGKNDDDDTKAKLRHRSLRNKNGMGPGKMNMISSMYSYDDPYHAYDASSVYCGGPTAPTCQECALVYGPYWCNGDCVWSASSNQCVAKSDESLGPTSTTTSDWSTTHLQEIIPAIEQELSDHLTSQARKKFFYDYYHCLYGATFVFTVQLLKVDEIDVGLCDRR